jgi:hypothetical protein
MADGICTYDGLEGPCDRPCENKKRLLCRRHGRRLRVTGTTELLPRPKRVAPNRLPDADIGYHTMHMRLRGWLGPASHQVCIDCGEPADEWSYNGGDPDERVGKTSYGSLAPYSTNPDYYSPRCIDCHRMRDARITPEQVIEIFTSTEAHVVISERMNVPYIAVQEIRSRRKRTGLTKALPDTVYERTSRWRKRTKPEEIGE